MFDPQALLPVVKSSFPKAAPEQVLEALTKLSKAHPELSAMQALAALQKYMKDKSDPSMGMMAHKGAL